MQSVLEGPYFQLPRCYSTNRVVQMCHYYIRFASLLFHYWKDNYSNSKNKKKVTYVCLLDINSWHINKYTVVQLGYMTHSCNTVSIICCPPLPRFILFPYPSRIRPLPTLFLQVHIITLICIFPPSPIFPRSFLSCQVRHEKNYDKKGNKENYVLHIGR